MTHSNGSDKFTSIAEDASEATLSTDNTWGYSTSIGTDDNWTNFSGLPIYTSIAKELAKTTGPSAGQEHTYFKIHAKAAASQPAGNYRNVITFNVVANVPPRTFDDVVGSDPTIPKDPETNRPTLQGAYQKSVCDAVEVVDSEYQFTDSRDHKTYWVAKLKDGKCWMTQNLDFDIDSTKIYTNLNTDIGYNGVNYSSASWEPDNSTIPSTNINANGNITSSWTGNGIVAESVDLGDWYYTDTWSASSSISYNTWGSSTILSETPYANNGEHGHVGNLYNWPAAIAVNNAIPPDYTSYTYELYNPTQNPKTSICPSGWRLPVISLYTAGQDDDNDYYNLIRRYKNNLADDSGIVATAPMWFTRIGFGMHGSVGGNTGYAGSYWSSTMDGSGSARYLNLDSYGISVQNSFNRSTALPIRCVSRDQDKLVITFNANGGTGNSSTQRIDWGVMTPLRTNTFTRSGYTFNGWSTDPNGEGDGYADGGYYRTPKNTLANTHVTLYAQWVPENEYSGVDPGGVTIARAYEQVQAEPYQGHFTLQDMSLTYNDTKVCDLVTVIGDKYPAIDKRDGKVYEITKAPDGRCWMNENLALDLMDSATRTAMNSTNTNATSTALTYLFNGGGDSSDQYAVSNWTTGQSYSAPLINAASKDLTRADFPHAYDLFIPANEYKFGIYYNYCAASAGSYCYGDGDSDAGTSIDRAGTAIDAEYDICPAGWRLPTGLSVSADRPDGGEMIGLYDSFDEAIESNYAQYSDYTTPSSKHTAFRHQMKIAMAGRFSNGTLYGQATDAPYWSSTRNGEEGMDTLATFTTSASSSNYWRRDGLVIRCIAK